MDYLECSLACSDSNCLIECGRTFTNCSLGRSKNSYWNVSLLSQDCPCAEHCPNGCNGCSNPICVCGVNGSPQNEKNLATCKNQRSIDMGDCIVECKYVDVQICQQNCVTNFVTKFDDCPCQVLY